MEVSGKLRRMKSLTVVTVESLRNRGCQVAVAEACSSLRGGVLVGSLRVNIRWVLPIWKNSWKIELLAFASTFESLA